MTKDTGGAAFPDFVKDGMSLRDYFAAKAMAASIQAFGYRSEDGNSVIPSSVPVYAYQLADEMLKARQK
jgi:hypothetical protein